MSALSRWLDVRARRERRRVLLEDALLGGRYAAYIWYRLRWVGLTLILLMGVNLLELWFFLAVFMQRGLLVAVVARNMLQLVNGFFFGALDDLRHRVPALLAARDADRLGDEIDGWYTLSLLIGGGASVVGVGYILWDAHYGLGVFSVFHLYWIACLVRLACELPVRALHSTVFAIRRVYRPFFSFALIDGVGLVFVLIAFEWIHLWSFAAALIVAAPIAAGVALFFVVRAYRETRLPRPRFRLRAVARLFGDRERRREALQGGVSYTLMRLGSFLVLVVAFFERDLPRDTMPLAVALHAIAPLINAGAGWAQLFYFDLKRLGEPTLLRLRQALRRRLAAASYAVGLILWVPAAVLLVKVYGTRFQVSLLALVLLFLLRARLAVELVDLFAARRYGRLLVASIPVVFAAWMLARYALPSQSNTLWAVDGLLALALVAAAVAVRGARPRWMVQGVEPFHSWRQAIAARKRPAVIVGVRLATKSPSASKVGRFLAAQLQRPIGLLDRRRLVWCHETPPERRDLVVVLGGMADQLQISEAHPAGAEALRVAAQDGLFGPSCRGEGATTRAELERDADDLLVAPPWELGRRAPLALRRLDHTARRAVLGAAIAFANGLRTRRQRPPFDVACLAPAGTIEVIYLLDRASDEEARNAFKATLRRINRSAWLSD